MVITFIPDIASRAGADQLADFNRLLADFGRERAQVLVVTAKTAREVRNYAEDNGISLPILADPGREMARAFEADGGDAVRSVTVFADTEGVVVRRFDPAPADGQAEALLAAVRAHGSGHIAPEPSDTIDEHPN
jgi:peroxiredoxin